jgi:HlyD family secretion protein
MKLRLFLVVIVSIFLISACSGGRTPTPLPTVVLQDNTSAVAQATASAESSASISVTASGFLVSDHSIELAFLTSGNVKAINAGIGQTVKQGDILAELDNSVLQLQLSQAILALNELTSPLAISNAQKAVAEDQSALNRTLGTYYWWQAASTYQDSIDKAKADLAIAEDELKKAQEDYDDTGGDPNIDKDKATAYQRLYAAQQKVKDAKNQVNLYVVADPYQLAIYKADVEAARAKLADDQTLLAALTGAALPDNPTGAGYAQLIQARNNVAMAQANLLGSQLISPINGKVATVNATVGDFVPMGQIQVVVVDPANLHVETTDLSERDVPNIKVGQNVEVNILPINQTVNGKVTAVSPQSDTLGGDVVYKVLVEIETLPEEAFPGMSVTINFLNE